MGFSGTLNAGDPITIGASLMAKPGVEVGYDVRLSAAMMRAVNIRHPDFKIWTRVNFDAKVLDEYEYSSRQSPSAVFGDFNNDGVIDAALFGHNKTRLEVIAVVSDSGERSARMGGDQYKVVDIWMSERDEVSDDMRGVRAVLTSYSNGEVIKSEGNLPDACNKTLKNDAFGAKNLDVDGIEVLFDRDSYFASCTIRKRVVVDPMRISEKRTQAAEAVEK